MSSTPLATWRLKKGQDRRFRSGHPWVYSNELAESPKGIEPGAPVELQDPGGKFLARGYGNPNSLIAFRVLSRDASLANPFSVEHLTKAFTEAGRIRRDLGLADLSHRLCFGEADRLPGLVVDRYLFDDGATQAFVIQAHTAGIDRHLPQVLKALENYAGKSWDQTAVIVRNDLGVRKLEGLDVQEVRVEKKVTGLDLGEVKIRVASSSGGKPLRFRVDLLKGQKTGFFLDQAANVQLAAMRLAHLKPAQGTTLRILDLCCYVGQWGAQLARAFREQGIDVEITAMDASAGALELARMNVEAEGGAFKPVKGDILEDLSSMPEKSFDLVISDPPALIKSRKDIPAGTHAYLQVNTQVFRLVRSGGAVVSCSCSGLLEEEEFLRVLSKAAYRNQVDVRWIARGCPAPDHPMLVEFPEGRYLKAWIGITETVTR